MTECTNPTVIGGVFYNGKKISIPRPFSRDAMLAAHGNTKIVDLIFSGLSGSKEAVNELLDFSVDRIANDSSLHTLYFQNVTQEVAEIETEILTVLASKAANLKELYIMSMHQATEQVRQAMTVMALDIIQLAPP